MDFRTYQEKAEQTVLYPSTVDIITKALEKCGDGEAVPLIVNMLKNVKSLNGNLAYAALGLAGEAGEINNKIKKVFRDNWGEVTEKARQDIKGELGDVLWYVAAVSRELGLDMDEIARENIDKLFSRKERGVLLGDGDNR